ncbi:YceI family protein [soil metagenome]
MTNAQSKIILLLVFCLLTGIFSFKILSENWKINQPDVKIFWSMPNGDKKGNISALEGTISFEPDAYEKGMITATVETKTIDAGIEKLNNHLLTADFFDAENHPKITFTSEKISRTDSGFVATGKLAMRDSIHTIEIPFQFMKTESQTILKGTMNIFAGDYGVGKKSPTGKDEVIITIEVPITKE